MGADAERASSCQFSSSGLGAGVLASHFYFAAALREMTCDVGNVRGDAVVMSICVGGVMKEETKNEQVWKSLVTQQP